MSYRQDTHVIVWVQADSGFWMKSKPTMRDIFTYSIVWPEYVEFRAFKRIEDVR